MTSIGDVEILQPEKTVAIYFWVVTNSVASGLHFYKGRAKVVIIADFCEGTR